MSTENKTTQDAWSEAQVVASQIGVPFKTSEEASNQLELIMKEYHQLIKIQSQEKAQLLDKLMFLLDVTRKLKK